MLTPKRGSASASYTYCGLGLGPINSCYTCPPGCWLALAWIKPRALHLQAEGSCFVPHLPLCFQGQYGVPTMCHKLFSTGSHAVPLTCSWFKMSAQTLVSLGPPASSEDRTRGWGMLDTGKLYLCNFAFHLHKTGGFQPTVIRTLALLPQTLQILKRACMQ